MRSKYNIISIVMLIVLVVALQVHTFLLQAHNDDLILVKDEIVFLQRDIISDSNLINEFVSVDNYDEFEVLNRKEGLDEDCDSRHNEFQSLVDEGDIGEDAAYAYSEIRSIHEGAELVKDELFYEKIGSNGEEALFSKLENYNSMSLEASLELEIISDKLSSETIDNSNDVDRNSLLVISLSFLVALLSLRTIKPKANLRLLGNNETVIINLIRNRTSQNRTTTIKDVKRECDITHPTAQVLINNLEKSGLIEIKRNGREKHLFLVEF